MTAYSKLTQNLWLINQPSPKQPQKVKTTSPSNIVLIQDISGSTAPFIREMGRNIQDRIDLIPDGDYLSYAVFSSSGGEYRVVLKGMKVDADSRKHIKQVIDKNSHATNLTCFSEVLGEISTIVPDLAAFSKRFSLMFFTDGYPVPDTANERKSIEKAIKKVAGQLTSVTLIGYGSYYKRELMRQMAQWFGGALIHASDLPVFSLSFETMIKESVNLEERIRAKVRSVPLAAFTVDANDIAVYEVQDGTVHYRPTVSGLWLISDEEPGQGAKHEWGAFEPGVIYAAALVLSQMLRADEALEVLSKQGDVYLCNKLGSAYTNDEFGRAEQAIRLASLQPKHRFIGGHKPNYLPDPSAFCVLDLLDLLMNDPEARFYPQHESYRYKRIGRDKIYDAKAPRFYPKESQAVPIDNLTWNEERLNLSILFRMDGTVPLRDGYEALGFAPNYPTFVFKNHTLIADGLLNMEMLPVTVSVKTFEAIPAEALVPDQWGTDVVVLGFSNLPIINRQIAESMPNATVLCRLSWFALELKAQAKVLKHFIERLRPPEKISELLSPAQEEFLKQHYITKSGFRAPSKDAPKTDYYVVPRFQIKIAGYSSLPKVEEVVERHKNGQEQTRSGLLMEPIVHELIDHRKTEEWLPWCEKYLDDVKHSLHAATSQIQRAKFAVVLAKRWFPEFKSRDECKLTVDGHDFEFDINPLRADI